MKKYLTYTTEEIIEAVKEEVYTLKYVKDQTEEICLEAVKEYGDALQYVKEQTEEICLEAVKQYGYALKYVEKYYRSVADIVDDKEYRALGDEIVIELNGKKYRLIK